MTEPTPSPDRTSLREIFVHARLDADGVEKKVLSLHDRICARWLAPPLAWLAVRLGCSADTVTLASLVTGLASPVLLAGGTPAGELGAVLLLQFSYLLDCADGDVARARGTASLDGYLRDAMRHQLQGAAIFVGWTVAVFARHDDPIVLVAGLLAAAGASRIVGGLDDQITLEGLTRDPTPIEPPPAASGESGNTGRGTPFGWLASRFLPDFAIMNWLTIAVVVDLLWLRPAGAAWLASDVAFLGLAAIGTLFKAASLTRLWRRGVEGRVEALRRRPDPPEDRRS